MCFYFIFVTFTTYNINTYVLLRWKVTKLNNGVRGQKNTPPECSILWENVSVFSLCVIINPSFSRRHEIGMVLAFLTSSNSRLELHNFGNYLQTNWSIELIFTPKCLFRQVLLISASLILQIRPRNVWSPKRLNLDICKICTFFAFEAKLLEIEAEDTIRFLNYFQVFSVQKRFVKEKIYVIGLTFSEIESSQPYPLSRERYESVNKYKY